MAPPPPKRFVTNADVLHLQEPWCQVEKLCDPQTVGPERLLLARATMPPRQAHNFHRHPGREEIIYVLEGMAEQWVGREKRLLGPGEMAHIPCDVPHASFNAGTTTLRFLAILSPVEAAGPFTVDVFNEEPWVTLRPPVIYPGYAPLRQPVRRADEDTHAESLDR